MSQPEPTAPHLPPDSETAMGRDAGVELMADEPDTVPSRASSPPAPGDRADKQRAFLLRQLLEATPNHRLTVGEANRKIPAPVARDLGLDSATATRVRDSLAEQGHLCKSKAGRLVSYELTDSGREYLQTLAPYPPPDPEPFAVEFVGYQRAHLLFQLFRADQHTLPKKEANRSLGPKDLELRPVLANRRRRQLAEDGLIKIVPVRRTESYQLTDRGLAALAGMEHYPHTRFTAVTGKELNALLELARSSRPATSARGGDRGPDDLSQAVFDELVELKRERFGHTELVPIHEVRQSMREKYGPDVARHDTLDDAIRELADARRVRLVAISDPRIATEQQLADSVPGLGQTFFYLGVAHE